MISNLRKIIVDFLSAKKVALNPEDMDCLDAQFEDIIENSVIIPVHEVYEGLSQRKSSCQTKSS